MEEKYKRIFSLADNLYCRNSPVIISSGALLAEAENGIMLVRLKFQRVSTKPITGMEVSINVYDDSGNDLGLVEKYLYLDCEVKNGHYFEDCFFQLSFQHASSFSISRLNVDLEDNSTVCINGSWNKLPDPSWLCDAMPDEELIRQYHIETNTYAIYAPQMADGLWQCSCGQWDVNEYGCFNPCSACGADKAVVFGAFNTKYLEDSINRLEEDYGFRQKATPKRWYTFQSHSADTEFIILLRNAIIDSLLEFNPQKISAIEKEKIHFEHVSKKAFINADLARLAKEYYLIVCDQYQWLLKFANGECHANIACEQWLYDIKDKLSIMRSVYTKYGNLIPAKVLDDFSSLPELEQKVEMMHIVQKSLSNFFYNELTFIDTVSDFSQINYYNDTEYDFNLSLSLEFMDNGKSVKNQKKEYKGIYSKQQHNLSFKTNFQWDSVFIECLFSFENVPNRRQSGL